MDVLIHHCLREISFDGDFGCDVSRLQEFIEGYYKNEQGDGPTQKIDDAFCAFVWAVIVRQPGVRVGTIPEGAATEVYIATPQSVKKKAKAKGEVVDEDPGQTPELQIVPDATIRSLNELRQQYGDGLRIAADQRTIFQALTGTHEHPSKLTPMVYTALQFITRGREDGISVLDLGKKSGYNQKACFYVIKQLLDLNLVVKRRKPGVSTNICVHKYFFERSEAWQQVVAEESQVKESQQRKKRANDPENDAMEIATETADFTPIDSRHLSSLNLIRGRLTKLLESSPHGLQSATNLLPKIGFTNPTKTDRRFFQSRLRELIDQRVVEKVLVKNAKGEDRDCICIRLVTSDTIPESLNVEPISGANSAVVDDEDVTLKMSVTVHRQIIDLLDEAGTQGMTLNEISAALCNFDRRTIELLLARLEKDPPPPHLADLGIAQLGETHGRERRYKYYTVAHFQTIAHQEEITERRYLEIDVAQAGGYLQASADQFYEDDAEVIKQVDYFKGEKQGSAGSEGKGKKRVYKNPILPDGTVKKGRPRKTLPSATDAGPSNEAQPKAIKKRKRVDEEAPPDEQTAPGDSSEPAPKRKRGRPPKQPLQNASSIVQQDPSTTISVLSQPGGQAEKSAGKKRVRPPKSTPAAAPANSSQADVTEVTQEQPVVVLKKRGRPRKSAPQPDPVPAVADDAPTPMIDLPPSTRQDPSESMQSTEATTQGSAHDVHPVDIGAREGPVAASLSRDHDMVADENAKEQAVEPSKPSDDIAPVSQEPIHPVSSLIDAVERVMNGNENSSVGADSNVLIDPSLREERSDQTSIDVTPSHQILLSSPIDAPPGAHPEDSAAKRGGSNISEIEPAAKRLKSVDQQEEANPGPRFRATLSQSRREKEILRVITDAGSIMNISSKEFYDAHCALVESMAKAGEVTSTRPGTRIDKRTVEATFNELESQQKMKLITTTAKTRTGNYRPVRVAYLPDIPQDRLHAFLAGLSVTQNLPQPPAMTVDRPRVLVKDKPRRRSSTIPSSVRRTKKREHREGVTEEVQPPEPTLPVESTNDDPNSVLRESFLSERNIMAQLHGFILGKAARARALHIAIVEFFGSNRQSSHVVSGNERILSFSYFFNELPVHTYCAVFPVSAYCETLVQHLNSTEGDTLSVGQAPPEFRIAMEPNRTKSQARLLDSIEFLCRLGLLEPLRASGSPSPTYICPGNEPHLSAFDVIPIESWTVFTAPRYFHLTETAPVHLWALAEIGPSLWRCCSVRTTAECSEFWDTLQKASRDADFATEVLPDIIDPSIAPPDETIGRILRRSSTWSAAYTLMFSQTEYLSHFVENTTGTTPLQNDNGGQELVSHLSWITCAPEDTIRQFFEKEHGKYVREHVKALKKLERRSALRKAHEAESTALIAKKAAEGRAQREEEWAAMVNRVHPEPLNGSAAIRVRGVRAQYMQSTRKNTEKWEAAIAEAIQDVSRAAVEMLSAGKAALAAHNVAPVPAFSGHPAKSVEEIIAQQGPRLSSASTVKKPRKKKGEGEEKGREKEKETDEVPVRRQRFQWNRDFDELARDALAIIKARSRGNNRIELAALEQVFPAVPRNSVRQRLVQLHKLPGADAYMQRLVDKWYQIWMQFGGTPTLPDEDPQSATNFNIVEHIKFLRAHIDKNALRVGFPELSDTGHILLPATVESLRSSWEVVDKPVTAPLWDFVWSGLAEEGREKQMSQLAFTKDLVQIPLASEYPSESLYVAESALKIILGTPNEFYDAQAGSQLLQSVGEQAVQQATQSMLARGVVSKLVRDPQKAKPGRTLKISESNQNAIGGAVPLDTFQDAVAQEEEIMGVNADTTTSWHEWSLVADDGDVAALLEMVSDGMVDFKVDTTHARTARSAVDWNSKKADDDDIETTLSVRLLNGFPQPSSPPLDTRTDSAAGQQVTRLALPSGQPHGHIESGTVAFCRTTSTGLVNCQACLEAATAEVLQPLTPEEQAAVQDLLNKLHHAGSQGLAKEQVMNGLVSSEHVQRLVDKRVPLAYWVGYTSIVLVAAKHTASWAVVIPGPNGPETTVFPRRWLDIAGRKMADGWGAALRAVIGVILTRPGISQAEIRWRLRSVYDRQELDDILRHLFETGFVTKRVCAAAGRYPDVGMPDDVEELSIFWFLGHVKRWYDL